MHYSVRVTSDPVDDQVHLPVGTLPQLAHHLVVLVDVELLQVLSSDQLQLFQDVDGGAGAVGAVGRGAHRGRGSGLETDVPAGRGGAGRKREKSSIRGWRPPT